MTDLRLFDASPAGRARRNDSVTSLDAARKQRGGAEKAIRELFQSGFVGTADEMCAALAGHKPHTLKSALSRVDEVVPSGRTKPSACGSPSIVWMLASQAKEAT